ncbi:MAG: helix-turn-helix transcriptional regulator [Alphaproteobacteria bacterium]|nr:helix-turn-helix transcriptional regulator [Alphaproteobacteria bacterium]
MSTIVSKVGARVRELRTARHLTQAQLAEAADLAPHTLSRIERGQQGPSLEAIERLSSALGVRESALFEFDAGPPPAETAVAALLDRQPADPVEARERLRAALLALAGAPP